jgi:hypothetical protein
MTGDRDKTSVDAPLFSPLADYVPPVLLAVIMSYTHQYDNEKDAHVPKTERADDVFGPEEGHQIQYKTLSWQARHGYSRYLI